MERARIELGLAGLRKSDDPLYINLVAREYIVKNYEAFLKIYTDGSLLASGVGSAFVIPEWGYVTRKFNLTTVSIFTAELVAILMALNYINELPDTPRSLVVLSDSLSSLSAIQQSGKSSREDIVTD